MTTERRSARAGADGGAANRAFARFRRSGSPEAIAELFDLTAMQLRRVARHLVGEEATADDLVQVTFLAAMEGSTGFEEGRDVLPWLTGILRNQAALVHRRRQRQPDPDRLAPAAALDPVSGAEAAELQREVERALAQLPPAYRPVLQLHLLHGLDAGAIARTLERPGGTVRTQIVRGLQKLRDLLPVGLTGLLAGLLPGTGLAGAREAVLRAAAVRMARNIGVTATTGSLLAGALTMKKILLATAAAALILVTGWLAAIQLGGADKPGQPEPRERTQAARVEEPLAGARESSADTERTEVPTGAVASVPPPTSLTTELRGVVRDGAGAGVAGATVLAWARHSRPTHVGGDRFDPDPDGRATTAEDGSFALRVSGEELYLLALHGELLSRHGISGDRQGREAIDGLELELAATAVQEGRLVDDAGEPVADYEFGTHRGSSYTEDDRLDIIGFRITEPPHLRVVTGDDGSFRARGLRDYAYTWEVQHPEHPMLRVDHAPRDGFLELRLEAGERLAGAVFRPDGRPAAGALVVLNDYPKRRDVCDAAGRFELVGVRLREALYLRVDDPESAIHCVQPLPENLQDIRVRLGLPRVLAGAVVDASGRGVPGVEVRIVGNRRVDPGFVHTEKSTWEWAFDDNRRTTDPEGVFAYSRLYDGEFEVQVREPDAIDFVTALMTRSGVSNLVIRLDRLTRERVTLVGTARDGLTGEPIPEIDVTVYRQSEQGTMMGHTHDVETRAGAFRIEDLAPGEIALAVKAPDYAQERFPLQAYGHGEHRFDVALYPRRSLEVIVQEADGSPAEGPLLVFGPEGQELWLESGGGMMTKLVRLQDGRAVLWGLPAKTITVRLLVSGLDRPIERAVDLTTQPAEPLVMTLGPELEVVRVPVGVLCCAADADLDAFTGPPGPAWLRLVRESEDVWWLDATAELRLTTAEGAFLSAATLEPGEPEEVRPGVMVGTFRAATRHFDGTSSNMPDAIPGPAGADLRGRRTSMVLRVSAPGYTRIERRLRPEDLPPAGADPRPIMLFLRRAR